MDNERLDELYDRYLDRESVIDARPRFSRAI